MCCIHPVHDPRRPHDRADGVEEMSPSVHEFAQHNISFFIHNLIFEYSVSTSAII